LRIFYHADFVTAVSFHPIEDKYFVSGSFDRKLRIWNIPDHCVVEWAQTANIITAATFSPNGKMAVAGLFNGQCVFYLTEGLRYFTQVDCRNRSGKFKKGKKVTGLKFSPDRKRILITTNDSRIRLYDIYDYSCVAKFKGLQNEELQIRASFSDDGETVICGSEDGDVLLWRTAHEGGGGADRAAVGHALERNESFEYFRAHNTTVTTAQFVPRAAAQIGLAHSHIDPNADVRLIVTTSFHGELKFFEDYARRPHGADAGGAAAAAPPGSAASAAAGAAAAVAPGAASTSPASPPLAAAQIGSASAPAAPPRPPPPQLPAKRP
jgi:WD40 repeat protein